MAKSRGWNVYGFKDGSTTDEKYKRCLIHRGTILVQDALDESVLLCPSCGLCYEPEELETITSPTSKFGTNKGKTLLQPDKKPKKMVSEQGDIIPEDDSLIIQEMQQGLRVLKYHEEKVEVMKKW